MDLGKGIVRFYLDLFQLQPESWKWGYDFHITPWGLYNHNDLALVKNLQKLYQVYVIYQTYIVPHEAIQPDGVLHRDYNITMFIMFISTYDQ